MAKYRGKYKKCRTCKHAKEVMNWMVLVHDRCPIKILAGRNSSRPEFQYYFTTKDICESCESWEPMSGGKA